MKRTLITLALVAAAGTAGAQTVTSPQAGGATVTPPSVGSGSVTTPPVAAPAVNTPAVPSRSVGVSTRGVGSQSVTAPSTANAPSLPNAAGSGNARAKIEADGYKNVQGLQRNRDGSWSGKALRGGAMVDVNVDARGHVITK